MTNTKESKEKNERSGPAGLEAAVLCAFALISALVIKRGPELAHFAGAFMISALLMWIVYRDIARYKPRHFRKPHMMFLLGLMVVFTLGLNRLAEYVLMALSRGFEVEAGMSAVYGVPVAAGAMLVMLLFDFHTAIVFSFVISLLSGLWLADASFTIYAFVGSLAAAFSMVRCKRRTAILRGGGMVLLANIITLVTVLFFKDMVFTSAALVSMGFAAISALTVVALVSLLLPVLESLFKVTTDISLLELLDLDHPLMKQLMISAPGTYHHSIIVGNLVEACSEVVGVNPLIARVGAYYHDIGKARMPEYFIENSASGVSKHERLTPHMSSMVLTSHVKEGVEMARQHKLPEEVLDIIEQHHGNSLITYFYEKARSQAVDDHVNEEPYRYPGPKPQSRTSALIMMADAVEAASRVLNDPTPARIAALVDKIINHIFLTGQLEECELTFKDIYEIKKNFTYILTGILHKRIDYPGFDFNEQRGKAAEAKPGMHAHDDRPRNGGADKGGLSRGAQVAGAPRHRA